ncbi:MAG TPA: glycosyltransferase, partial [Casimicrobiaceae bacterium]|nr:glycosyltransferase [Casimicrobiaceae bacterium]
MPNAQWSPTVGLPSGVLCASDESGQPDGISIYTRELARALVRAGIDVRRVGRRGASAAADGIGAVRYSLPWTHTVGLSTALPVNLPLAGAIEREIDVYHATDYIVP